MSYARFAPDSDVYVYLDVGGYLNCCACGLGERNERGFPPSQQFKTTADMLAHLDEHKVAGHDVPQFCIDRLKEEAEENDDWIANYDPAKEREW